MDVQELLGKVAQNLSVNRAFGTAYEKNGSLVIPVALVAGGGGGGEGSSGSPATVTLDHDMDRDVDEVSGDEGESSGSGGGFGGVVLPAGVYVVKDDHVRWVPAVNANLVILVAFLTLRMIARARRKSRRHAS